MQYRQFGNTKLIVSQIGFGCGRLAGTVEHQNDKEARRALELALDGGVNYFDTADLYAQGRCEKLLGQALKGRRPSVIIATKAGYRLSAAGSFAARLKPLVRPLLSLAPALRGSAQSFRGSQISQEFTPDYLRAAIEASLRRLQTDYIDVFQLHSPPAAVIRAGEYIGALEDLKAAGKIRYYGISCAKTSDAEACLAFDGISSVQIQVNLLEYASARSFLSRAAQKKIAVAARQPFAAGFLARPAAELNPSQFPIPPDEYERAYRKATRCQHLACAGRTLPQAALQVVLGAPAVSVVLPGMSSRAHLRENLAALTAPQLTANEIAEALSVTAEATLLAG